jgi:hypothetical protein
MNPGTGPAPERLMAVGCRGGELRVRTRDTFALKRPEYADPGMGAAGARFGEAG